MEDRRAVASTSRAPLLSRTWCWSACWATSTTPATAPRSPSSAAAGTTSTRSPGPTSPYPSAAPPLPRCCAAASPRVESLKLKAKPRAAMLNLIPDDWGGQAGPWLAHAAAHLDCLKAVHLRRMVLDDDALALALLLRARGHVLHTLRLDKCSGFSSLHPPPPPPRTLLQVRDVLGDRGLEILAQKCKMLRWLRIERAEDEHALEDEQGKVSHVGLSSLALGRPELEYLAVYASDIMNAALECFGMYSKKLYDFRLVLLDREERITDLPLDNGVRALLSGCKNLQRFSLYLRPGGLSDVDLGYIGEYSGNIRYMLLGNVGVSDGGLMQFARACSNLQKLELRNCCFSEGALAHAAPHLHSLRYLWVQGYQSSPNGRDLIAMARPYWNIEFIPRQMEVVDADHGSQVAVERQAQILAYYSLAGRRSDLPEYVVSLHP